MEVLLSPIITEKANAESEDRNRFTFKVHKDATKHQIKKAIESFYGVKVEKVRTSIRAGKSVSRMSKSGFIQGNTGSWKKAVVEVASGQTIDLYSNL
jgi:large subunit ribosomal protein L23